MERARFIGIDISKDSLTVAILEEGKSESVTKIASNKDGIQSLLRRLRDDDIVVIETGNFSFRLCEVIQTAVGATVYVLNANALHMIWKSHTKTDKHDAIVLAEFVKYTPKSKLPLVQLPTEYQQRMRETLSELLAIDKSRTQAINRLHNLFWNAGYVELRRKDFSTVTQRQRQLERVRHHRMYRTVERVMKQIDLLEEQRDSVEYEQVSQAAEVFDSIKLSLSMPGIGLKTANAIYAYFGTFTNFHNYRAVSRACGLVPRVDQSGKSSRHGHITKAGPAILRRQLVLAAWAMIRSPYAGPFRETYDRIRARRGSKIAVVAVARKMIEVLYQMHKTQTAFESPNPDHQKAFKDKLRRLKLGQ